MTNKTSNIRVMADYRKPNADLGIADAKEFLGEKLTELRSFEQETLEALRIANHTSKEIEPFKSRALKYEQILSGAANWLEDKILETSGDDKDKYEALLQACNKLKVKNNDVKQNIVDDLTGSRVADSKREVDPATLATLAITMPITLFNFAKASGPHRDKVAMWVGLGSTAVGVGVVFRHHAADLLSKAKKVVPAQARKIGISMRGAYIAAALGATVLTKEAEEIQPSFRPLAIRRPMIACILAR